MSPFTGHEATDPVDQALAELELYAADAWSNLAIVERVKHIRRLRDLERVRRDILTQKPADPGDTGYLVVTPSARWA